MEKLYPEFERILVTEEQIQQRVDELAAQISADYQGKGSIVLIGILKGSFMFTADLARRLTVPHYIDFMALSSYGQSAVSGAVRILLDLRLPGQALGVLRRLKARADREFLLLEAEVEFQSRNLPRVREICLQLAEGGEPVDEKVARILDLWKGQ